MIDPKAVIEAFEKDKHLLQQLSNESKHIIVSACSFSELHRHKTTLGKAFGSLLLVIKLAHIFKPSQKEVTPL